MKDRFGDDIRRFQWINEKGARLASLYGFDQITTPILEHSNVFERTLGEDSDVVGKELYTFVDKGGDSLTLRPEGTAGITRSLISNNLCQELPRRFYYFGPMFRHERPQKGRLRQFEQFGVEVYGESHPASDVETIELASTFLKSLGLESAALEINSLGDDASRQNYRNALRDYLTTYSSGLSQDSLRRLSINPLRILDSKEPQDIAILGNCPVLSDYLSEFSRQRFAFITEALSSMNIPFTVNPRLVRGLDYYQDTVFEFKVSSTVLGTQQGTVLAGGRYDGLVEKMGGPSGVSSIGWAAGLERLSMLLNEHDVPSLARPVAVIGVADPETASADNAVALSTTLYSHVMAISSSMRQQGIRVEVMYPTSTAGSKNQLKKQLSKATKINASHAVMVGSDEIKMGTSWVRCKDLDTAEQKLCLIDNVIEDLQSLRK
ncbi:hypothetical protein BGZ54_010006 [Gamsiella multidivaricata]|nr:hypothetical protein BGZ54_010006 [Gamsiella multidivaricata]